MLFIHIITSYLIGSIPFGFIIAKIKGIDIRRHGSGNIGATNVWRTIGPGAGLAVLALDASKGAAAVYIGRSYGVEGVEMLTGIAALVGHAFPLFLGFRGGKIIATGAGVLLALAPPVLLIAFTVFIIVVLVSRYVSLGSVCAALSVPLSMFLLHYSLLYNIFGVVLCLFAVLKHIPNIKRLAQGTESKISLKSKKN